MGKFRNEAVADLRVMGTDTSPFSTEPLLRFLAPLPAEPQQPRQSTSCTGSSRPFTLLRDETEGKSPKETKPRGWVLE